MQRFEYKGKVNGAQWYDDNAHTPEEIQSTLKAVRERCPGKKIVAVFQPHTYSRTYALFDGFSRSFTEANEVILLDIFASAREEKTQTISSNMLVRELEKIEKYKIVKNMKTIEAARAYLASHVDESMVVITMGAGDVYKIYEHI